MKLWFWIFLLIGGCIAMPIIVKRSQPEQFEASLWIQIRPERTSLWNEPEFDAAEFERFRKRQIQVIRSPIVIDRALRDKEARTVINRYTNDPKKYLPQALTLRFERDDLLVVGLVGTEDEAEQLGKVVQAVVAAYHEVHHDITSSRGNEMLASLEDTRQELERKIKAVADRKAEILARVKNVEESTGQNQGDNVDLLLIDQDLDSLVELRGRLRTRAMQLGLDRCLSSRVTSDTEISIEPLK